MNQADSILADIRLTRRLSRVALVRGTSALLVSLGTLLWPALSFSQEKLPKLVTQELLPEKQFLTYDTVLPAHRAEWEASAVDRELIEKVVVSLPDRAEDPVTHVVHFPIAEYLDLDLKYYQPHSENSGWLVRQVSPLEPQTLAQSQIKLDPQYKRHGRKYENPASDWPEIGFLDVPNSIATRVYRKSEMNAATTTGQTFWQNVLTHNIPIIVTEGAKKAGSLLTLGYASITLPGVCAGITMEADGVKEKTAKAQYAMKPFITNHRHITIVFDHDQYESTRQFVRTVLYYTAEAYQKAGASVHIIDLPGPEKGVDDFIKARGAEAFDLLYKQAKTFDEWKQTQTDIMPISAVRHLRGCH